MKITPELREVLRRTIIEYGNVAQFAKTVGVAHSTVLFWLNGKSPNMSERVWLKKIRPVILPFLTDAERAVVAPETDSIQSQIIPVYRKVPIPENFAAPLLTWEQAAEFEPSLESVPGYISRLPQTVDCRFSIPVKSSYFALRFQFECAVDTLFGLIGGGEYPEHGDLVLAKIRSSGTLTAARFFRRGDDIALNPFSSGGCHWNCRREPGYLCWCFPVLEFNYIFPCIKKRGPLEPRFR